MDNCIFCKIATGDFDSARIWEDEEFVSFLDINPNVKGMALVVTKQHFDAYAFDLPDDVLKRLIIASKKVARILEMGLNVFKVAMVLEGLGVNHVHIKLYPLYGVEKDFKQILSSHERIFFDTYLGFISTQLGPQAKLEDLMKLATEIKEKNK